MTDLKSRIGSRVYQNLSWVRSTDENVHPTNNSSTGIASSEVDSTYESTYIGSASTFDNVHSGSGPQTPRKSSLLSRMVPHSIDQSTTLISANHHEHAGRPLIDRIGEGSSEAAVERSIPVRIGAYAVLPGSDLESVPQATEHIDDAIDKNRLTSIPLIINGHNIHQNATVGELGSQDSQHPPKTSEASLLSLKTTIPPRQKSLSPEEGELEQTPPSLAKVREILLPLVTQNVARRINSNGGNMNGLTMTQQVMGDRARVVLTDEACQELFGSIQEAQRQMHAHTVQELRQQHDEAASFKPTHKASHLPSKPEENSFQASCSKRERGASPSYTSRREIVSQDVNLRTDALEPPRAPRAMRTPPAPVNGTGKSGDRFPRTDIADSVSTRKRPRADHNWSVHPISPADNYNFRGDASTAPLAADTQDVLPSARISHSPRVRAVYEQDEEHYKQWNNTHARTVNWEPHHDESLPLSWSPHYGRDRSSTNEKYPQHSANLDRTRTFHGRDGTLTGPPFKRRPRSPSLARPIRDPSPPPRSYSPPPETRDHPNPHHVTPPSEQSASPISSRKIYQRRPRSRSPGYNWRGYSPSRTNVPNHGPDMYKHYPPNGAMTSPYPSKSIFNRGAEHHEDDRGISNSPHQRIYSTSRSSFGAVEGATRTWSDSNQLQSVERAPFKPCHNVPGLWFVKTGLSEIGISQCEFDVDTDTMIKWNLGKNSRELRMPQLSLNLMCLLLEDVQDMQSKLDPQASAAEVSTAISQVPITWPPLGTLIIQINPSSQQKKTWLPHDLTSSASGVNFVNYVCEGKNTVQLIQLSALSDYIFILFASYNTATPDVAPNNDSLTSSYSDFNPGSGSFTPPSARVNIMDTGPS